MNNIVLHIPHSSLKLPIRFYKNCIIDKAIINKFNKDITDLYTDELFKNKKHKDIKTKYSRIYCDVEKFADNNKEIMAQFGMGFVYTHTNNGVQFIKPTTKYKDKIYSNYYINHHNKLDKIVSSALEKGPTILIDCHSFSHDIIMLEDKKNNLPDICIGFDNLYYNERLVNHISSYFENLGYSTKFNYPYSGTIIPNKYLQEKSDNLYTVMIEINKKLYLDDNNNKNSNFSHLRKQIQNLFSELEKLNI